MSLFADIIFPTAVRQSFTYSVPESLQKDVRPGMRVWVPLQKHTSIGMVAKVHATRPDFKTRDIKKILDDEPIVSEELLELTEWVHRFYYCSWGEVVQAALPAGLNFYAEKHIQLSEGFDNDKLTEREKQIVEAVEEQEDLTLKEAEKRWSSAQDSKALKSLLKRGILEVWEQPVRKLEPQTEKKWYWSQNWSPKEVHHLLDEYEKEGKLYKWVKALDLLVDIGLPRLDSVLKDYDLLDYYSLNRIAEEGIIEGREEEVTGFDLDLPHQPEDLKQLNAEQEDAFRYVREPMKENRYENFLLYGITGSGKTEIYIHALKEALEAGKGGLILVPEISLTPQTVKRFYRIFGDQIAVLHSRLSARERYKAWNALRSGEKKIAIGARSAVFAPIQNLGLIVVDEEHDSSYKQEDPAPRYHAREVAVMRAFQTNAVVISGSATPSMRSLFGAQRGKSTLLTLSKRHEGATLPEVQVLDLKQYRSAMKGPLTVALYEAIKKALEREEQVILLHNRRGFSSYMQCENCGHMPECPNCSVSLTYHKPKQQLRCHYCGFSSKAPRYCSSCSSEEIKKKGFGTQQIEEDIAGLFPEAEIERMDRDTTAARHSHERILGRFDRKEIDILLGTQLVAKGLDFPNVTVVGVIDADTELAFPSFRSGERMYQLLSQVAGRSGRAEKKGKVYFQTWQSDHYAVQCAKEHDHRSFARHEMNQRKKLQYPPYTRLIGFQFKSRNNRRIARVAHTFTQCLQETAVSQPVLGPSPSTITRMQGWIRWECLVKMDPDATARFIEHFLDRVFALYDKRKPDGATSVRINVNVDALE